MLKGQEGVTLAMLSLSVVILLMIAFTTILLVFDSGIFPTNETKQITQDTNNQVINEQTTDKEQPINRTEAINVNQ